MCCARTAALQAGTKCPLDCHAGFPAAMSALSSKIVFQTRPRPFQHPTQRRPKPFKIEPRGTHESPDATKSVQEARNRCPRDAQERPKAAEQRPKCGQNASKKGQGDTQTPPKTNPASLKTRLAHDRDRQPRPPACRNDFSRFVALRALLAKCAPTH